MTAALGSLNGVGNFHTLAAPDQLHNAAFSSLTQCGVFGRLNTAGVGICGHPSPRTVQLSPVQNLGKTSINPSQLRSYPIPGNYNGNILQGRSMSMELGELQNNRGVNHIGQLSSVDYTTIFPVSDSLMDSSSPLTLDGNSLLASLHASNLRGSVSATGFQNGSAVSDFTSIAPASNKLQDSKADIQGHSSTIPCNLGQIGRNMDQCLDQNNPIYNKNTGLDSVEPLVIEEEGYLIVQPRAQGSYILDNMEPSDIENEGYLIVHPWPLGSYVSDDIGSLEDLASVMMEPSQEKGKPADGDFGCSAYSLETCI